MSCSPFIKPCGQCKGAGETSHFLRKKGVCPDCKGTGCGAIDYAYLENFQHKIWEQAPNEKIPALLRQIEDGIQVVEGLRKDAYRNLLSTLYYMRGQSYQTVASLKQEPAYFIEAVRHLLRAHELGHDCSSLIENAKSWSRFNSYQYDQEKAIQVYRGWHPDEEVPAMTPPTY